MKNQQPTTNNQQPLDFARGKPTTYNPKRITHHASRITSLRGFTLMELMIVIVLVGILISVGLTSFKSTQAKSRDGRRKSDLRHIVTALEAYWQDKGQYPADDGSGNIMGCGLGDSQACAWGSQFADSKGTIYMVTLPGDPVSGRKYYYDALGINKFQLYARLENTLDLDVPHNGTNGKPQSYSGLSCGNISCNYGVASTNTTPASGRSLVDE